jgi:HEPN domain-containing protein
MSAELVIAGYVRIAKQDLDGARLLNAGANRNAAYLCEQAAEKLIRAVLTSERTESGTSFQTWSPRSLMRIR